MKNKSMLLNSYNISNRTACGLVHIINEGRYPLTFGDPRVEQAIDKIGAKMAFFDPLTAPQE